MRRRPRANGSPRHNRPMRAPDPERGPESIDDENPEWTDETFAKAVPFSALPTELQQLLSEPKHIVPDAESPSTREPAA